MASSGAGLILEPVGGRDFFIQFIVSLANRRMRSCKTSFPKSFSYLNTEIYTNLIDVNLRSFVDHKFVSTQRVTFSFFGCLCGLVGILTNQNSTMPFTIFDKPLWLRKSDFRRLALRMKLMVRVLSRRPSGQLNFQLTIRTNLYSQKTGPPPKRTGLVVIYN